MENTLPPMAGMALGIVLGIVFFLIGFFMRNKHRKKALLCTAQTNGTVIDFHCSISTKTDDDGRRRKTTTYYPIFTYMAEGKQITKTSSIGTGSERFQRGQMVTIFYNPNDVEQYYVPEDKAAARGGFYFMAFGVLVFMIGLIIPVFF